MRRAIALAGMACALLAFPLASGAASGNTWSGTWSRAEDGVNGNLILVQSGNSVSGHYTWNDGSGRVSGTVSGSTFTGGFNESHYQGSFVLKLAAKSFTGSYTGKNKDTGGPISGPFDGNCVSGPCSSNGAAAAQPSASTPFNEVHVTGVSGEAYFHKGGTPADAWLPLEKDTVLKAGDSISTDPDGTITMGFADGSTATLGDLTALKVGSLFADGGVFRVKLELKWGQIREEIQRGREGEVPKSDFRIVSPTAVSSVRGTIFTVFYDPSSGTTTTTVTRGVVEVDPVKAGLPTQEVPAGKSVDVTHSSVSPQAAVGKLDLRGGIDQQTALRLVATAVGAGSKACKLTFSRVSSFSVKPSAGGWAVSVTAVAGSAQGVSIWLTAGTRAKPANALAKKIAARCR
jgi:FecR protein